MGTALGSCPLWDCKLSNHGLGPGISLWQRGLGSWAAGSWLACHDLSSSAVTAAGLTRQPSTQPRISLQSQMCLLIAKAREPLEHPLGPEPRPPASQAGSPPLLADADNSVSSLPRHLEPEWEQEQERSSVAA